MNTRALVVGPLKDNFFAASLTVKYTLKDFEELF